MLIKLNITAKCYKHFSLLERYKLALMPVKSRKNGGGKLAAAWDGCNAGQAQSGEASNSRTVGAGSLPHLLMQGWVHGGNRTCLLVGTTQHLLMQGWVYGGNRTCLLVGTTQHLPM